MTGNALPGTAHAASGILAPSAGAEIGRLVALFDGLGDGIVVYDAEMRAVAINAQFFAFYGFQPGDVRIGQSILEIRKAILSMVEPPEDPALPFWPDLHQTDIGEARALFANRTPYVETVSGPPRRRYQGLRLLLDNGHAVSITRDMTVEMNHLAEIERQKSDLQTILDNIGDGVALQTADCRYVTLNERMSQLYGVPPGRIGPGAAVDDFLLAIPDMAGLPPAEAEAMFEERRAFATGGERGTIATSERRLGNGRTLRVWRNVLADGRRIFVMRDATDEIELEQQREQLEWITETVSEGVLRVEADGRVTAFNRRFVELYEMDPDAVRPGMHVSEIAALGGDLRGLPDHERERLLLERLAFSTGPETTALRELANGRTLHIRRTFLPGGGTVATLRDVTEEVERRRLIEDARASAEAASRAKSEFIARMSHELRTPMHGVLGMASLLESTALDERQRQFLEIIARSGQHMVHLIDDLLMVATLDSFGVHLEPQPVDIGRLAIDSLDMVRARAEAKGLGIVIEADELCGLMVVGDPHRLTQVLVNLAANAVKFTPQGHIRLTATAELTAGAAAIAMVVADTGPGIPPERRGEVFEQFHQLDGSVRRSHEGVGLGLAITRSLVGLMGGTIEIGGAAEGGASFTVRLSLMRVPDAGSGAGAGA